MSPYSATTPAVSFADQAVAAFASADERRGFIQRTYLTLLLAIIGFAAILTILFMAVPAETLQFVAFRAFGRWTWLVLLAGFMGVSWLARGWAESDRPQGVQYAGLILYVVAQALLLCPLLVVAQLYSGASVVPAAAAITLTMFGGLTAVTFITRTDFSFLRMYLWWGGLIAIGLVVCGIIFQGLPMGVWFSVAMIALASGYILYDTSNVVHHYRTDQHVAAALALFASVALLFWYVLRLLMAFNRSD